MTAPEPLAPVTGAAIEAAARRIAGHLRTTPVLPLEPGALGVDGRLTLKLELLQHTGSFKPRGVTNRMLAAGAIPAAGVVAASGGNHGLAVGFVAGRMGVPAEVFVPTVASAPKVERLRATGATVRVVGDEYAEAADAAAARAAETGALEIHPYDHPDVVAGQGTVGRELDHQAPALDTVLVAVGGGGLLAGIAAWYGDRARVVAVEPARCPTLVSALAAGQPVDVAVSGRAADSLGARRIGAIPLATARRYGVRSVLVEDDDIADAQRALWDGVRVLAEPGGAAAAAALLAGAYRPEPGERVGVVVCGANVSPDPTGRRER